MTRAGAATDGTTRHRRVWTDGAWLAAVAVVFLLWRVPLMLATAPGLDEDWFGVTGMTILRSGVPRIPYLPARDPKSFCYGADILLFALPPLSFYLQALSHAVFGDGIGPARFASAVEGLAAAFLCYRLALRWSGDRRGSILAAAAYVASRAFLFPATTARPDMAATALGLLAVFWADRCRTDDGRRWTIASGLAAGLALLAHPFAVVPATQVGLRLLLASKPWRRRITEATLFSLAALATFSLWGLLIVRNPELFRIQFGNNVLNRAGPGVGATLLAPGSVLKFQAAQVVERVQPIQLGLYGLGLGWALIAARRSDGRRELLGQLVASVALLLLFEGRHPTLGYYAYPAAFASIAVGMAASDLATWAASTRMGRGGWATPVIAVVLLLAFLPGAGFRALESRIRHRDDPAYDIRGLTRAILADIPRDALVAVDGPFVIEFYLDGRDALLAVPNTGPFDFRPLRYEYAVLGRLWEESTALRLDGLEFVRSYGHRDDPFSPYATLYRKGPAKSGESRR